MILQNIVRSFQKIREENEVKNENGRQNVGCCCYPAPSEKWGIAEDHRAPEAGQLPRAWIRGRKDRVAKERAAQRVRSWKVQNKLRGVLRRVSSGAAGWILDSANPEEIRA